MTIILDVNQWLLEISYNKFLIIIQLSLLILIQFQALLTAFETSPLLFQHVRTYPSFDTAEDRGHQNREIYPWMTLTWSVKTLLSHCFAFLSIWFQRYLCKVASRLVLLQSCLYFTGYFFLWELASSLHMYFLIKPAKYSDSSACKTWPDVNVVNVIHLIVFISFIKLVNCWTFFQWIRSIAWTFYFISFIH